MALLGFIKSLKSGLSSFATGVGSGLTSLLFNRHLTGAQREANEFSRSERVAAQNFNAAQASLAFQRELQADSSKHAREVNDMKSAGLNPMLAAGASGGSVSASPASVSPASASGAGLGQFGLSSLLDTALKSKQLELLEKETDAKVDNLNAETDRLKIQKEADELANDFFKDSYHLRMVLLGDQHDRNLWERSIGERGVAVKEAAQSLAEENARHYNDWLDKQGELIGEQIKSEGLKRAMYSAYAREANASASYKLAMQEVDRQYTLAKTATEKEQKELLAIEARFKNGVFTPQYIKDVCKAAHSEAEMRETLDAYSRGDYSRASKSLQKVYRKLEKDGQAGNFSVSSAYFGYSNNAASAVQALPTP